MTNLKTLLSSADPLRDEPPLAAGDARAMRARMLAAIETLPVRFFPAALQVAALVAVTLVVGAIAGQRLSVGDATRQQAAGDAAGARPGGGERRQVQFATPGGTRIIWTIDPDFQLKEVMP
jgi:hypothetical protein